MQRFSFLLLLLSLVLAVNGCGSKSSTSTDLKDSPVYYEVTCVTGSNPYWVGINRFSEYASLALDWGYESDRASLLRMAGSWYHYQGYGQQRPGYLPRHFQVAFSSNFSSVHVYFNEYGRWVLKTTLPCSRQ